MEAVLREKAPGLESHLSVIGYIDEHVGKLGEHWRRRALAVRAKLSAYGYTSDFHGNREKYRKTGSQPPTSGPGNP
jgi:hypothetical protein